MKFNLMSFFINCIGVRRLEEHICYMFCIVGPFSIATLVVAILRTKAVDDNVRGAISSITGWLLRLILDVLVGNL